MIFIICIVTAHKRSLGQGNIFTPVCHSVHRGGVRGCGEPAWLWVGVHGCGGSCVVVGACMVAGGMCGWGACMVVGGHAWSGGMHGCRGEACIGYDKIRSMSGRYASYWNAFLFNHVVCVNVHLNMLYHVLF